MPVSAPFRGLQATSLLVVLTYTCFFSARQRGRRDAEADTYLHATERSAFEHGVSAEEGATARRLSQVLGREILFIDADADFHGCTIDGVIYLGAKSERSVLATVAHEYTHLLEGKGLYDKLRDFVFDTLVGGDAAARIILGHELTHILQKQSPTQYKAFETFALQQKSEQGNKIGLDLVSEYMRDHHLNKQAATDEVVADYAMRALFSDMKTARVVTKHHTKVAEAIRRAFAWIREKLDIRTSEIDRAAAMWNKAYSESRKNADAAVAEAVNRAKGVANSADAGYNGVKNSIAQNEWQSFELSDEYKRVRKEDRHAFLRSLANKTSGMRSGETRRFMIIGVNNVYFFEADGYMSGSVVDISAAVTDYHSYRAKEANIVAKRRTNIGSRRSDHADVLLSSDIGGQSGDFSVSANGSSTDKNGEVLVEPSRRDAGRDNGETRGNSETKKAEIDKLIHDLKKKYNIGEADSSESAFSIGEVKDSIATLETDSEGNALTEAQQKFFSGSLVTDEDGALLPVYHATDSAEFTVFDKSKLGYNTDGNASDEGMAATAHVGFWFNTKDLTGEAGSRAEKVYLNLTNPYELTSLDALAEEIKALGEGETPAEMGEAYATDLWLRGYDGIEIQNDEEFGGTSYVAFDENQIKRTTNKNPTKDADIRYSVGGIKAKTADVGRLADAERMEQGGADSETVRRETGWYRGYDGKWRFEIDDSKMHFINHREESRRTWKLDELIRHDALFAAYPELRDYTVLNFGISDDVEAAFYPGLNRITLDPRLSRAEKRAALIHEIQHAIQLIEGFTAGATTDYWRDSLKTAEEKQLELRLRDFDAPDIFFEADMRKLLEGTPAAERDAAQTALEKHYGEASVREYVDLYNRLRDLRAEREQDAERAYRNTAGEIEASDVANRIGLSEMQRAETRPDIDREEVRFSNEHPMFTMEARQTDADADTEVSDADKRFAPVESAIKLLKGGADLWRTLRETGASPREIALRMATSGESDAAIRELTGLYRDALGVWTYDKAWLDAHVPDIADTRELRAGYKLGTVDEQMLELAPEEVKASRRRLLDSAKLPNDADAVRVRQAAAKLHRGLRPTAAEFAEDRKTAAAKEAARLITAEKVPSADAAIRTGALLADIADVLEKKKVRAETITRLTAQVRGENGAWETDNAAMTKIIRAGSKQLDVQDFTDFLFENAKELTESSYNSQYGHKETYALDKLGVQIQNPIVDIAKYGTKPSELIANEREQEELKRYIENEYANAAHPTTAERADARDVKREFLPDMKTVGEVARFFLDRTKWRMLYCVCI